jgi:hypothetical protein
MQLADKVEHKTQVTDRQELPIEAMVVLDQVTELVYQAVMVVLAL